MLEPIRPKRANGTLEGYWLKLYVPVPVGLKCEVQRVCRERHMSQAEFGLRVVRSAFCHEGLLAFLLDHGDDAERPEHSVSEHRTLRVVGEESSDAGTRS